MSTDQKQASGKKNLLRGIGMAGAVILVLNSIIGAGIFALPSAVAASAGILSPWLFLIVGVLVITIVLTFAELASYFKESGGPVLFTTSAFGPLAGFSTGWLLFISRMAAFAANTTVMALYLGAVIPWFSEGIGRIVLIVTICVTLTWVNILGVKEGVRAMAVITVFKIVPIVLLIILGMQHVSGDILFPDTLPKIDNIGSTTLLLIYAFVGFESATIMSGETKNPKETLPRALVLTPIFVGIFYFLIVVTFISVLDDPAAEGATLIDVGRELMGPKGALLITFAAFFSIGGNLSSIMLAVPRLPFALAEKGLLPSWFGHVHKKYATPSNSILMLGGLGLAFALSGSFVWLAVASSLTRLLSYVLCIGSLPIIRSKATEEERAAAYRLKGGYTIPIIALMVCLFIGAQSTLQSWLVTGGLFLVGLVLYAIAAQGRKEADK
ncbi:MAG: amino acid permease [Woeseia sp.]|nr:amino acid permease [Woeseia sp.]MBT6210194.1 amino acid permease [Woeseia sp.]